MLPRITRIVLIMIRKELQLTFGLVRVINDARGEESFQSFVERRLWRDRVVKKSAKDLGIEEPKRRKPGRPKEGEG